MNRKDLFILCGFIAFVGLLLTGAALTVLGHGWEGTLLALSGVAIFGGVIVMTALQ